MKWIIGTLTVAVVAAVSVGLSLFVTGYWSTEISEGSGAVAAVSESRGDSLREGIKVRGVYEIEVRDPDGTLVARQIFPNAVTDYGKGKIAQAMSGENDMFTNWTVALIGSGNLCGVNSGCLIRTSNLDTVPPSDAGDIIQSNLQKSVSGSKISLSGTFIAGGTEEYPGGTISVVRIFNDGNTVSGAKIFAEATGQNVAFSMGQTINVSYTLDVN